jgi:phosphate transport system permease protein
MTLVSETETVDLQEPRSWRRTKNRIATILMALAMIVVTLPLGWVVYAVIDRGASIISWKFLTAPIPPVVAPATTGGMGPAVLGTLLITGWATLMAVPLGILGAIYINEYGARNPIATLVRFLADVMTGVPSIVMGLFIFSIWTLRYGFSGFAGSLALACLMLPIVIRSSEEMLKLVPNALREASYALGASKTRVTITVVLPAALGGIVSGSLLAVARGAGETAPLLFTILTVFEANRNVFHGANTALATQIFSNATQPYPGAEARAWGAALTLIAIAFILMVAARIVTARFTRQVR